MRVRPALLGVLSASAIAVGAAIPASASAACANETISPSNPAFLELAPEATLCLLNEQRALNDLPPLTIGPAELSDPALAHSKDMVARRFFGHVNPDGVSPAQRMKAYWEGAATYSVGENIYSGMNYTGSVDYAVRAWMNSPGHRAAILSPKFKEIGIGIVRGYAEDRYAQGATYTTTFGARTARTTPAPSSPAPDPVTPKPGPPTTSPDPTLQPDPHPTVTNPDAPAGGTTTPPTTPPVAGPGAGTGGVPVSGGSTTPVSGGRGPGGESGTVTETGLDPDRARRRQERAAAERRAKAAKRAKTLRLSCRRWTAKAKRTRKAADRRKREAACKSYRIAERAAKR